MAANLEDIVKVLEGLLNSETYTTPMHTAPSIGATTTVVLAANTARLYALLINISDEVIYIELGAVAALSQGIPILPWGNYEMSGKQGNLYKGAINGISTSGSKTLLVTEGV